MSSKPSQFEENENKFGNKIANNKDAHSQSQSSQPVKKEAASKLLRIFFPFVLPANISQFKKNFCKHLLDDPLITMAFIPKYDILVLGPKTCINRDNN